MLSRSHHDGPPVPRLRRISRLKGCASASAVLEPEHQLTDAGSLNDSPRRAPKRLSQKSGLHLKVLTPEPLRKGDLQNAGPPLPPRIADAAETAPPVVWSGTRRPRRIATVRPRRVDVPRLRRVPLVGVGRRGIRLSGDDCPGYDQQPRHEEHPIERRLNGWTEGQATSSPRTTSTHHRAARGDRTRRPTCAGRAAWW